MHKRRQIKKNLAAFLGLVTTGTSRMEPQGTFVLGSYTAIFPPDKACTHCPLIREGITAIQL